LPKIGVVTEIFLLEGAVTSKRALFLKVHLTSAANHAWLAFEALCIRRFNGDTAIFREDIFHICAVSVQISLK